MQSTNRKLGPPGSNLFLFHLPNNMKDSELYNHFRRFGNIYSTRVMTEKNGKSKGIGFVSFDNPKSAQEAIEEMNGFEVRGKRLKVELNKKDEKAITNNVNSLNQARFDFWFIIIKPYWYLYNLSSYHTIWTLSSFPPRYAQKYSFFCIYS